ncbi:MAG: site-specific DNA-methyltransferase, partial [Euryarchaeota archaeon]|nr:site-specific DNA-methyltransferase [Euryarchaeota archaeon]MCG2736404.1 site-specific DNA-methyltransferase [Candidatus Methanoperedenaceae archaeon]
MSSELPPQNPDWTIQEERLQYGAEKKKQRDTARLIWASKPRKEPSPKDLDFQTAEIVIPNKATGDLRSFFETEKKEIDIQPNRLIWGDNLLVMQALLAQGYEGQIDLIYIDPPFNTGENFNFPNEVTIGDKTFEKEMPMSERLAYTDTWDRGIDSFLDMLYPRLQLMRRLLSSKGCIYLHCDANASHYIKIMMDEVFGNDNFRNEIVVRRIRKNVRERTRVPRLNVGFDSILFYSKTNEHLIEPPLKEDPKPERWHSFDAAGIRNGMDYELFGYKPKPGDHWRWSKDRALKAIEDGILRPNPNTGKPEYFIPESTHILRDNFWDDITAYSFNYNYPTEKKEDLLQLIIDSSSSKSDLIADFFCGSGTTAAVAEKLERRWITTDLSKTAIQVARARLVNQNAAPFLIQNLGNYQRQLIYMRDVKLREMYNIILKLYGAAPRDDMQGFGIKQDDKSTLVFVCEPDRPMTGRKAIDLAKQAHLADGKGYKKIVILAWDYELDFDNDFSRLKAAKKEIADCEFKVIPSDVLKYLRKTGVNGGSLADKITFYQKPYLRMGEPNVRQRDGDTLVVQIKIEQYVVLDIPLKDEEKRPEIEKMLAKNFAALIDYWTV